MVTSEPLSVAIVGGGISGLILAIGLLHNPQLEVSIFEASSAFTEIGAGLALGPNAQRALRLISPDVAQAFEDLATGNLSSEFSKVWFNFRRDIRGQECDLDLGAIENDTGQQTVHRAKFLDALTALVPQDKVQFGKRLLHVVQQIDHVVLRFEDGTTAKASCAIGADGVHSNMRKYLLGTTAPAAAPVFSGFVAYRGLIPMEIAHKTLGKFARDAYLWCGNECMVMIYPIDDGQVVNVVAACHRKTWDDKAFVVNSTQEQFRKDFDSLDRIPRKVIELLGNPMLWGLLDHNSAPCYYLRNTAVIGDAAHATTPFQGAGAGQAIEDALVLSELLGRVQSLHDIEPAFTAYDAIRRPRTERVVQTSRQAMKLFTFTDAAVGDDVEKWKQAWEGRMNWIWDIDLEAHVADALDMFELNRCACEE
ncbi:hypothetical protein HYE67_011116 [Fusarium culmorum]|uniref:Salicylate hydroxylase n=1 Tax=Fusarium culmorum TaxID=5516 RepID=A0A2T4GIH6_FUSCU|nr:Salicylate hydroxylase [Fusarium culmorum]QPC68885.1 hypothetical protein HYE67_011116 [Fusarium culmorum]